MAIIVLLAIGALLIAILVLAREKRIAKAETLGFVYDDSLSYNQNKSNAVALRSYADDQAELYAATGRTELMYYEKLHELGFSISKAKANCPYAIADLCTDICSALKC